MNTELYRIIPANAEKIRGWIKNRGGVAVWRSINLSNPGASWSSPATLKAEDCQSTVHEFVPRLCPKCFRPVIKVLETSGRQCNNCSQVFEINDCLIAYQKPNWQCANEPERIITREEDVLVDVPKEIDRFKIHTRLSGNGLMVKLTDHSSAKVCARMEKHSEGGREVWRQFDYDTQECVIYAADKTVPLNEWKI